MTVLDDGRPLVVATERERIGQGPWARLFATAVVADESSSSAERGRALARDGSVHTVAVAEGLLSGRVEDEGRARRRDRGRAGAAADLGRGLPFGPRQPAARGGRRGPRRSRCSSST